MPNNETAFPVPEISNGAGTGIPSSQKGMDLRDYFAAAALPTLIAAMAGKGTARPGLSPFDIVAESAYLHADAMMKARAK